MIYAALTALITLLVGPTVFFYLSYYVYTDNKKRKWPVGPLDLVGDIVFLPLFNALVVYYGLNFVAWKFYLAVIIGAVISLAFIWYRKDIATHDDWTRPRRGVFNFAGWYHMAFFFPQTVFIAYALMALPDKMLVWLSLQAFFVIGVIHWVLIDGRKN